MRWKEKKKSSLLWFSKAKTLRRNRSISVKDQGSLKTISQVAWRKRSRVRSRRMKLWMGIRIEPCSHPFYGWVIQDSWESLERLCEKLFPTSWFKVLVRWEDCRNLRYLRAEGMYYLLPIGESWWGDKSWMLSLGPVRQREN